MINFRSTLILWLMIPLSLFSQKPPESFRFNIKQCVKYALENHPNIRMAEFDVYITQREADYITGMGLPQVNASVNLQSNIKPPQFILTLPNPQTGQPQSSKVKAAQPWQHNAMINASQLVFDGTFFLGLKAAKEYVNLSRINVERSENEAIEQVVNAYYSALLAKEASKIIDANITRLEKLYKDTDVMYKNGLVEKIDLDRIQITLNNLATEKMKVKRFSDLSVELLKFQMGMNVNSELSLTEELPALDLTSENVADATPVDVTRRVEYTLIRQQEIMEDYNRRRYIMSYYPSLYAFGYYQWNMQGKDFAVFNDNTTFGTSAAGLKLNVPIFDGLRTNAKVQQSKVALQKIGVSKEMFENSVQLQYKNAIATLLNSKDSYKIQESNVTLAQSVFEKAQLKYKEGVGSSLEVNNAEVAMKEAQNNLLSAKFEYLNAKLKLAQVRGELKDRFAN